MTSIGTSEKIEDGHWTREDAMRTDRKFCNIGHSMYICEHWEKGCMTIQLAWGSHPGRLYVADSVFGTLYWYHQDCWEVSWGDRKWLIHWRGSTFHLILVRWHSLGLLPLVQSRTLIKRFSYRSYTRTHTHCPSHFVPSLHLRRTCVFRRANWACARLWLCGAALYTTGNDIHVQVSTRIFLNPVLGAEFLFAWGAW